MAGCRRALKRGADPEARIQIGPLSAILDPIDVEHVRAWVSTIDTGRRIVVADGEKISYDRLVLAAGSKLVRARRPGGCRTTL
jgi:NADH:ubiquinone reductase (H+-translocating)